MDLPRSEGNQDPGQGTIHFQFSGHAQSQNQGQDQGQEQSQQQAASVAVSETLSTVHLYNGPDCYVQPKGKSNLKIIKNAVCSVCLAGDVNLTLKQKTLYVSSIELGGRGHFKDHHNFQELDNTTASHAVILFRDTIGFKFRGIYSYNPGERHVRFLPFSHTCRILNL